MAKFSVYTTKKALHHMAASYPNTQLSFFFFLFLARPFGLGIARQGLLPTPPRCMGCLQASSCPRPSLSAGPCGVPWLSILNRRRSRRLERPVNAGTSIKERRHTHTLHTHTTLTHARSHSRGCLCMHDATGCGVIASWEEENTWPWQSSGACVGSNAEPIASIEHRQVLTYLYISFSSTPTTINPPNHRYLAGARRPLRLQLRSLPAHLDTSVHSKPIIPPEEGKSHAGRECVRVCLGVGECRHTYDGVPVPCDVEGKKHQVNHKNILRGKQQE